MKLNNLNASKIWQDSHKIDYSVPKGRRKKGITVPSKSKTQQGKFYQLQGLRIILFDMTICSPSPLGQRSCLQDTLGQGFCPCLPEAGPKTPGCPAPMDLGLHPLKPRWRQPFSLGLCTLPGCKQHTPSKFAVWTVWWAAAAPGTYGAAPGATEELSTCRALTVRQHQVACRSPSSSSSSLKAHCHISILKNKK